MKNENEILGTDTVADTFLGTCLGFLSSLHTVPIALFGPSKKVEKQVIKYAKLNKI